MSTSTSSSNADSPVVNDPEESTLHQSPPVMTVADQSPGSAAGTESIRSQPFAFARCSRSRRAKLKRNAKAMLEFSKHHGDGAGAPLRPKRVWLRSPHWLTASFQSKNDEFHKLFKQLPADAFLIDDYSCAVQKEILIHGRMYVSQEHLCFHSNIFGFETSVVVNLVDIVSLTPEKTAHLIPNALRVVMRGSSEQGTQGKDKSYWFTSFISRDTSFTVLMKVWQNVLMGSPMTPINLRHFACRCWGVKPDVDVISDNKSQSGSGDEQSLNNSSFENDEDEDSDADDEGDSEGDVEVECGCESHIDSCWVDEVYPVRAEKLYELFFTESDFVQSMSSKRQLTDVQSAVWETVDNNDDDDDVVEKRSVVYTMPVKASIGPKTAVTTEQQRLVEKIPGRRYRVRIEVTNAGVPYCDNFYTYIEYCITSVTRRSARLRIGAGIRYRKSMLGFIKSMIEKQAAENMKEHYTMVKKLLTAHTTKKKRRSALLAEGNNGVEDGEVEGDADESDVDDKDEASSKSSKKGWMDTVLRFLFIAFVCLLLLNITLLAHLVFFHGAGFSSQASLPTIPEQLPDTPDGWKELLRIQRQHQYAEVEQVKTAVTMSGKLLGQLVNSLENYASVQSQVVGHANLLKDNTSELHNLQDNLVK